MDEVLTLAQMAHLVSSPSRAAMLLAMSDGRALPASELAFRAGISSQTASEHLALMKKMGILCSEICGRHRYYRIVSHRMMETIEDLLAVSAEVRFRERPDIARVAPLRQARMCYDHLAGRLGVTLAEQFQKKGWVFLEGKDFQITDIGRHQLEDFGVDWPALERSRRLFARRCIDWSERKPHIGGAFGAFLATRFMELDWIRRSQGSRVVYVTNEGRRNFLEEFGIVL
ncbi:MAG: ArsR/SmtB family transcription factor [Leptospirales bacterium]